MDIEEGEGVEHTYKQYGIMPVVDCRLHNYDCIEYHRQYRVRLPEAISMNCKNENFI